MKLLPLFGVGIRAISDIMTRQRRVNVFYHIREDQDRAAIIMCGTPGTSEWITLPTSPIWGYQVVQDILYVVAGTVLYSVTPDGSYAALGTLFSVTRKVSMADNSFQLLIVDGVTGYICTLSSGAVAKITDADFPNGTESVDCISSRFIAQVPNTREFRLSALLDGLIWSPMIYGTKEGTSDLLRAAVNINGVAALLGTDSAEFWQDIGTSPNPLQRINGATQQWGLAALHSVAHVGNTLIFLGRYRNSELQVLKWNGYTPQRASTSDIEKVMEGFSTVDDAVAITYMVEGHTMYMLTFPTEDRSFLFDDNTGIWSESQTGADEYARHFAESGVAFNFKNYVSDDTSGTIYLVDSSAHSDHGEVIRRVATTRHIRSEGNPLHLSEVFLDFETGVGTITGQGSDPVAMIRVSRDGGRTFGNERRESLGKIGEYSSRVVMRRLGMARDFVIEIVVTDPVKFVLASGSARLEGSDA